MSNQWDNDFLISHTFHFLGNVCRSSEWLSLHHQQYWSAVEQVHPPQKKCLSIKLSLIQYSKKEQYTVTFISRELCSQLHQQIRASLALSLLKCTKRPTTGRQGFQLKPYHNQRQCQLEEFGPNFPKGGASWNASLPPSLPPINLCVKIAGCCSPNSTKRFTAN